VTFSATTHPPLPKWVVTGQGVPTNCSSSNRTAGRLVRFLGQIMAQVYSLIQEGSPSSWPCSVAGATVTSQMIWPSTCGGSPGAPNPKVSGSDFRYKAAGGCLECRVQAMLLSVWTARVSTGGEGLRPYTPRASTRGQFMAQMGPVAAEHH
jgi:hypothetical protein